MKNPQIRKQIQAMSIPFRATVREAMKAIDRGALGTAILVEPETGKFKGIVTDGDLRRALLNGLGLESSLSSVERPKPRTARAGASAEEIASILNKAVRVVPLLDEHERVVDLVLFDKRMRLPVTEPLFGEKELEYVTECVVSGWVSSAGKFVTRFEEMFAEFCETKYAVSTSNGTTALHLAMLALDIGPGDEVIVPSLTFVATANAVSYVGAKPVFVDSDPQTWNIDPDQIEQAISPKTKAVVPVHLYGHPANMDPILDIAKEYNLAVIEDAAEAHGALYKGKCVGSIGDIGVFSFYGNKIITTGEGGMITTDDENVAKHVRMLRDHGMSPDRRYWHPVLGYNYRMTNLQAALGVAQMERIHDILKAKARLANSYKRLLSDIPGLVMPPAASWAQPVCWLFSPLIQEHSLGIMRDDLINRLKLKGIDTRPFFPPLHTQPIYADGQQLPVAERISRSGISLPSAPHLTADDLLKVSQNIRQIHRSS